MVLSLGEHLHKHTYPPLFWRFPRLAKLVHAWNRLLLQRNWLVHSELRRLLSKLAPGSLVIDAGSGDGQHLFPAAQRHADLRFLGLDKIAGNAAFCGQLAQHLRLTNLHFRQADLAHWDAPEPADLLLCVGTLQYVPDDGMALRNFHKALKNRGLLLLYVPVNGQTVLPFYRHFFEKKHHYEKAQQRQRVYTAEMVQALLRQAGFEVRMCQHTYGRLGIIGHELYSLCLMGLVNAKYWGWAFVLALVLTSPIVLIFKGLDFLKTKTRGNGLLVLASKRPIGKAISNPIFDQNSSE